MASLPSPTCGGTGDVLPRERAKASFDIGDLQKMLGGARRAALTSEYKKLFESAPFNDQELDDFLSYEELFKKHTERAAAAVKIMRSNMKFNKDHRNQAVSMGSLFNTGSIGIHFIAFLPYLETQANDAQKKKWLRGARNLEYIGAYAQTELGHGSNVRGLETTATFDPATDEFVIHSPTLSSIKWWPTGMYVATHGVVFAQMIIKGKNYGFHGFMVQFRDDQGRTMPGVEVGEIGPKLDSKNHNIGYARFTHVRVPRFNMMVRSAEVSRDGQYQAAPPKLSKFKYIGMLGIRVGMVSGAYSMIAAAATVTARYLCVRKQGFRDTKAEDLATSFASGENAVLDYQLHQYRVLKAVGYAYMFQASTRYVSEFLARVRDGVAKGDESAADELPELHATMSGMKPFCTIIAHREVEAMRRACGGQGFLRASGVADGVNSAAEPVTAEGESVILALQLARFLIKSVRQAQAGQKVVGSVAYLQQPLLARGALGSGAAFKLAPGADPKAAVPALLALLADRAHRAALALERSFKKAEAAGAGFDEALNKSMVVGYKAAECHTLYVLARNNVDVASRRAAEGPLRAALLRLFELVALQQVWEGGGDFVSVLDEESLEMVVERVNALLAALRPDVIALTDGFGLSDETLKSTLGRYDGNVYEAIYAEAKLSPLNRSPTMIGWDHISKIVDMDFVRKGMGEQRQGAGATKGKL